jgi:signal transduction histidine kinase
METGKPYEVDLELAHPTPETHWIVARGEAKRDANGKIWGLRGTAQNITERKNAEQVIRKAREELEERFRERSLELEKKNAEVEENQMALMNIVEDLNSKTVELEQANAKLHELDKLKSMFIASMSHELRTPLNSIIGFSSIMLNEWAGPVNAEQKENLTAVLRSGKHLLSLINDVIDVSKIEAGKIETIQEAFDISDLVSEAVETFKKDIDAKGLALRVRAPRQVVRMDRRRLLQCLLNLLSNAVKFTQRGSIAVLVEPSEDGRMLTMVIEDTGSGIREEDLGKLFLPFVRFHAPADIIVPGTGLGLYLTNKLVREILRGDILVSSVYGTGTRFTLRVPMGE